MDNGTLDKNEDIFVVKRHFFTQARDQAIKDFFKEWLELRSSAIPYTIGIERIPNMKAIIESKKYENYKEIHSEAKLFSYAQAIKRECVKY